MNFSISLENEASSSTGHFGPKQHGQKIPTESDKEATNKVLSLVTLDEEYTELVFTESFSIPVKKLELSFSC